MNLHSIFGYVGAFFLFCRFIPIIYEQIKKPRKINYFFLLLESISCILLGISAGLIYAIPFMIGNGFSLLFVIIVVILDLRKNHVVGDEEE